MSFTQIRKRDGRIVEFEKEKIVEAIWGAATEMGGTDKARCEELAGFVVEHLEKKGIKIPSVEDVQDAIEYILIREGHAKTARAFIVHREKHREIRQAKEDLGVVDDIKLPISAIKVLEKRYLRKTGDRLETPSEMFLRVAKAVAKADRSYGAEAEEVKQVEQSFFEMMKNMEFLPNSPTLMNAGTGTQQLVSSFVLPIEDSIEGIFETLKKSAIIQMSGGGTGFSFSRIRPKGDVVQSTGGFASGPVSFLKLYNNVTESVLQAGKRRGAGMGMLSVHHPDILEFIIIKEKNPELVNFNLSVGITDKFMKAVKNDSTYPIINPRTGETVNKLNAHKVFSLIVTMAWKSGDPGVVFIDRINKSESNPVPELGEIESTDPCGENAMYPYESCILGSINLEKFVEAGKINWDRLRNVAHLAVHFLDNAIDVNKYPFKEIDAISKANRRIGLGIMGFAGMLILLEKAYDSDEAVELARKVMKFIDDESKLASSEIAKKRGSFPNFDKSIWKEKFKCLRNATTTTIAPTGTISLIAGCSSGIEPLYGVSFIRTVLDNTELLEVNPIFEKLARERGFYDDRLMRLVARKGSLSNIKEVPKEVRSLFVTTHDISPDWHVKIQSAFQKHVDNAISKTINIPETATADEVEKIYLSAYENGCKGITIYRDKSRDNQVLNSMEP